MTSNDVMDFPVSRDPVPLFCSPDDEDSFYQNQLHIECAFNAHSNKSPGCDMLKCTLNIHSLHWMCIQCTAHLVMVVIKSLKYVRKNTLMSSSKIFCRFHFWHCEQCPRLAKEFIWLTSLNLHPHKNISRKIIFEGQKVIVTEKMFFVH